MKSSRWNKVAAAAAIASIALGTVGSASAAKKPKSKKTTKKSTKSVSPSTITPPRPAADVTTTASLAAVSSTVAAPVAVTGPALVISTDLPLQGSNADASRDTNRAIELLLAQSGNAAGKYPISVKFYDNSTAATGGWDDATCTKNATDHLANAAEVAIMGTFNSGCAKFEVPTLNLAPGSPMLMLSHANTNPGLTRFWDPGEPAKHYPTGTRNYGRVTTTDDYQAIGSAQFARQDLGLRRCLIVTDAQSYGLNMARSFRAEATRVGVSIVGEVIWDPQQTSYVNLFADLKAQTPDCVFLAGINDNNGEQVVRDKVAVFGPNTGAVKLLATDGFSEYPSLQAVPEADGMYISVSNLPLDQLLKRSPAGTKFVADFRAKYGADPVNSYAVYGAAAYQLLLKSVAASDGTRRDVVAKTLGGGVSIPVAESLIGIPLQIDVNGEMSVHENVVQVMSGRKEVVVKAQLM
jgi:branched-chain amino acid transport system substrate-binding protein